jgi:exopolysaccharide biosynthesis polyprenyl glycosylphosphotransferase
MKIEAPVPPNRISRTSSLWSKLVHVAGLPLLVGLAIFVLEGEFSVRYFKQAWPIMVGLGIAYVGAWGLSSRFERYPFINQFEAALYSTSLTILPVGIVLYTLPVSPLRNLALVTGLASIAWYLGDKFLSRLRFARFLVLPGGLTNSLARVEGVARLPQKDNSDIDGVVVDLHRPLNGEQDFLAVQSMKGVPVYHAGFLYEVLTGRVFLDAACSESTRERQHTIYPAIKRLMDLAIVLVSLPIVLPVSLLTAAAIRLESEGDVLFWQERVGQDGETFDMVKFRSMYTGNVGEDEARFASETDSRVTRVGQFIRNYRIDELPQFWNVLRGEMSIIGPRPEQPEYVDQYRESIPHYNRRHSVKPGITGWAQVRMGYAADEEENRHKVEHDLYYVKNYSIVLDLLIVYLTIKTILTGFGAR